MSLVTSRRRLLQEAAWTGAAIGGLAFRGFGSEERDPFAALPGPVWARARINGLVMIHHPAPVALASRARIVRDDEPGKPLIVEGRVFAPDATTTVEGISVYAYNTDAEGYYGTDHKEYPPRLYGWMKTDAGGRFELRTILPGRYPGMQVPAHVHFTVWGRSYPPQWVNELRFEGDRDLTATMWEQAAAEGEFRSIRPLTRTEDGVLHCRFKIRLQRETNFC